MVKKLRRVWEILYGAAIELIADDGLVLAASIAFFTIFSLAPLLLLVVALAGLAFGQDQTRGEIQSQFESPMGPESAQSPSCCSPRSPSALRSPPSRDGARDSSRSGSC